MLTYKEDYRIPSGVPFEPRLEGESARLANEVKQFSEVNTQLEANAQLCEGMEKCIADLEQKLYVVLRPDSPGPAIKETSISTRDFTPLEQRLFDRNMQLKDLIVRIEHLTSRVSL